MGVDWFRSDSYGPYKFHDQFGSCWRNVSCFVFKSGGMPTEFRVVSATDIRASFRISL